MTNTTDNPTNDSKSHPTYALEMSRERARKVVLHIEGLGDIRIVRATLATRYRVFEALMQLCTESKHTTIRNRLLNDDTLHLSSMDDWFYILNELHMAGVVLPIVEKKR